MTGQKMIHISSDDMSVQVVTERDITPEMMHRIEKLSNSVINNNLYHDLRGHITTINMSLYLLEKMTPPDATPRFQKLKEQFEDLSRTLESVID